MDDDLLDLFGAVANGFHVRLQGIAALDELNFTTFQARMLSLIGRHPACSQQTLSAWTGRDKAQVARTVKELEGRGFITRHAHQSDWRAQSLHLTPEGEQASNRLNSERAWAGAEMLEDVTLEERQVLLRVLSKMRVRLVASGSLSGSHDIGALGPSQG